MSKDDNKNSLEDMMGAVVSIHGGEVSLKGGASAAGKHYHGAQKRNLNDQNKTD